MGLLKWDDDNGISILYSVDLQKTDDLRVSQPCTAIAAVWYHAIVTIIIRVCWISTKCYTVDINVGNTIINNPQVITIFIGGMFTIPKWVVYDIVSPTLILFV